MTNRRFVLSLGILVLGAACRAQVPDLLTSFDAGNASLGAGAAFNGLAADASASYFNPAGLGYARGRTLLVSRRAVPGSRSKIAGSFSALKFDAKTQFDSEEFTQIGFTLPFSSLRRGAAGTLGFSYYVGGNLDDIGTVANGFVLPVASGLNVTNFREERHARTEFYTVAYGRTAGMGNWSYGFGLTYARQRTTLKETGNIVDGQGQPVSGILTLPDIKEDGGGVGVIGGIQYTPPRNPDTSFGASIRTPISLGSNSLFEVIPGRLLLNAAQRLPGLRRGSTDYAVVGVESQTFFGGKRARYFDRKTQTTLGLGGEYNLAYGNARIPLRLGYLRVPSGGDGFGDADAFTYGIGYRPGSGDFTLDANFVRPKNGGTGLSLTASYRFR